MRCSSFRMTVAPAALGAAGKAAAQNTPRASSAGARYKVVCQLSEGIDQAVHVIRNLRNHLNGTPSMKIMVVALGHDIDFLVEGIRDAQGHLFDIPVAALAGMGVRFHVCHNPLTVLKVPESKLLLEAKVVPTDVVEITRLQQEEGFTYIKP